MADVVAELEQLNELREAGALTEEEYQRAKARLLGQTAEVPAFDEGPPHPLAADEPVVPTAAESAAEPLAAEPMAAAPADARPTVLVTTTDHVASVQTLGVFGPVFASASGPLDPFDDADADGEGSSGDGAPPVDRDALIGQLRSQAMDRLVVEAARRGSNMVVGLRLDQTVAGGHLTVTVYGTAVTGQPRG
ncbi:hypothetical protein BH23ACT9_BH23ACT9_28210 [soil metagenome]